jgi:hypothetical protein
MHWSHEEAVTSLADLGLISQQIWSWGQVEYFNLQAQNTNFNIILTNDMDCQHVNNENPG